MERLHPADAHGADRVAVITLPQRDEPPAISLAEVAVVLEGQLQRDLDGGGAAGGGGGGGFQISTRGTLTISGELSASGGSGADQPEDHGAGGGGSGGMIVLEATILNLGGTLTVDGGDGGENTGGGGGGQGNPGSGATSSTIDGGNGIGDNDDGGGGGGGGGGIVWVSSESNADCNDATVSGGVCSDGGLPTYTP